jgi:hypothetical protein
MVEERRQIVITTGAVNVVNLPATYDVSDRANRALGIVSVTGVTGASLKGKIINTSIAANTNFFGSNLAPSASPVIFRINVTMNTAGVLTVRRIDGATTVSEQLNGGANLIANASYIFDILVATGQTINLQYSTSATIVSCIVVETSA